MNIRKNTTIENSRKYFTIAFDYYDHAKLQGRLYHTDLIKPIHFCDVMEFVESVEGVLNSIQYPREVQTRRLHISESEQPVHDGDEEQTEDIIPGKISTAMMRVVYRQNATWQGVIEFNDKSTELFKSFMGLMHIIENGLSTEKTEAQEKNADDTEVTSVSMNDDYFRGCLHQAQYDKDIAFESAWELIREIIKSIAVTKYVRESENTIPTRTIELYGKTGKKAVCDIRILFTENDSLQGTLIWREGKQQISFRSFLELLTYLDMILKTDLNTKQKTEDSI